MKKLLVTLSIILFTPLTAMASCGGLPTPPQVLELPQLSSNELEPAKLELENYYLVVTAYRDCIDGLISGIAPADAPVEYFDSPEYQAQFDTYVQLSDAAKARMKIATDRFGYLLANAN